ncbi:hypothetical protein [Phaffia rhodozyma]|uniref:Uncharacterized protein n=1 Tax=Phaffia rhodozyma TaxID=264483 RepID=A0A0F7SIN4_PHARH|nr:hypothetical protein [Phaffia rhodozyma]
MSLREELGIFVDERGRSKTDDHALLPFLDFPGKNLNLILSFRHEKIIHATILLQTETCSYLSLRTSLFISYTRNFESNQTNAEVPSSSIRPG